MSSASATATKLSAAEFLEYLVEVGATLLSYGCPTHRLEQLVTELARIEGYGAQVFAVPSGLFVTLSPPDGPPIFRMTRVEEWGTDLERLLLVDAILNEAAEHRYPIQEARRRLHDLETRPRPYSRPMVWAATAAAAGASAVFFRGGPWEAALGIAGGALIAVLGWALSRSRQTRYLSDFL